MKRRISYFLFLAVILAFFYSCTKDADLTEALSSEDRLFDSFLASENVDAKPTASGLYYVEKVAGTGNSPVKGDYVLINYSLYTLNQEKLVFTTYLDIAEQEGIYDSRVLYGPGKFILGENIPGLDEGLQLMKEGGSATLLFKSELAYGASPKGPIEPYSSLQLEVELLEVIKDPALNEQQKTMDYLASFWRDQNISDNGIYYYSQLEGEGEFIKSGDFVSLAITGKLLDGRIFFQSRDYQVKVGSNEYDLTKGLNLGLTLMKRGGSAIIVVPYRLGFGELGKTFYNGYVKTPIPPYSSLVYEVTIRKASSSFSNQVNTGPLM